VVRQADLGAKNRIMQLRQQGDQWR
jgi:hypothetical protein